MSSITMYSTGTCPWCVQAERLLSEKGFSVDKIRVDQSSAALQAMIEKTGKRTVPQIFIGEQYVGGFDNLAALEHQGQLDSILTASATQHCNI